MKYFCSALILLATVQLSAQERIRPVPVMSLTESAAGLAMSGVARRDARTVMAAAEILRVVERGTARVQRLSPPTGPKGVWDGPMTSASLLRLASKIATDEEDWETADYVAWLMQLPDSVPTTRGAATGPVWADSQFGQGQEVSYAIDFAGGESPNLLHVSASKPTANLECILRQGGTAGPITARIRSLAGTCSLRWQQRTAGKMTLQIRNNGPATAFVLFSN